MPKPKISPDAVMKTDADKIAEAVADAHHHSTCSPVLLALAHAAEKSGAQARGQKEEITNAIFLAAQSAVLEGVDVVAFHVNTCAENDYPHERPVEKIDLVTGLATQSFERVRSASGATQPSSFKLVMTAARGVIAEGQDIAQFRDTVNDKGLPVSAFAQCRKAYSDIREAKKDVVAELLKQVLKKLKKPADRKRLAEGIEDSIL
tara:strand:- start:656 stop:1270 length:615 start_codon:yes stop_codon:yes gene_type:complete